MKKWKWKRKEKIRFKFRNNHKCRESGSSSCGGWLVYLNYCLLFVIHDAHDRWRKFMDATSNIGRMGYIDRGPGWTCLIYDCNNSWGITAHGRWHSRPHNTEDYGDLPFFCMPDNDDWCGGLAVINNNNNLSRDCWQNVFPFPTNTVNQLVVLKNDTQHCFADAFQRVNMQLQMPTDAKCRTVQLTISNF